MRNGDGTRLRGMGREGDWDGKGRGLACESDNCLFMRRNCSVDVTN